MASSRKVLGTWLTIMVFLMGCAGRSSQALDAESKSTVRDERLDLSTFIGERLHLSTVHPTSITRLKLNLVFPEGHKLLIDAHPHITLYSHDGRLLWKRDINEDQIEYSVNKNMSSPIFYAKVGVYYCKEGDQGLCLIQNILYEVTSSRSLPPGPLELEYYLPGSHF